MSEEKENKPEDTKPDPDVEVKEKKTKKIKIDINRDPEISALQEELAKKKQELDDWTKKQEDWLDEKQKLLDAKDATDQEKEEMKAKLDKYSLEQFEKDKKEIIDLAKSSGLDDDKIAEIDEKIKTAKDVAMVKSMVNMLVSVMPKKEEDGEGKPEGKGEGEGNKPKPQGKAPFVPPPDAQQFESGPKMIDNLYRTIYDPKVNVTKQEREEAIRKKDQLWKSFIEGESMKQLKRGVTIGKTVAMACPSCAHTLVGDSVPAKCPYCGYNMTKTGDREPSLGVS